MLQRPPVTLAIIAVFFAVTLGVYGSSLGNQFVTWDDTGLILENKDVQRPGIESLKHVFSSYDPELYIPLTFVSYQINHVACGNEAFCYHLTDLVLHTLNSILVSFLLYSIFGEGWIAIGLGLIFALHPLNTEAVAWASARKDTLSTFFFLLSFASYAGWRSDGKNRWYWLSVILFLLGLLSKVMILTLPAVLLLFDWAKGRTDRNNMIAEKVPYFVLSVAFGIVALFGKTAILVSSTTTEKILMAAKSTLYYLVKFFVPADLSVMYPYTSSIRFSSPDFWIPVLLIVLLFASIGAWIQRGRPWPATGLLFFLVTLLPTFINFSKGGDVYFASDRYAYVPMIGLLIVLASAATAWLRGTESRKQAALRERSLAGAVVVTLLVFAYAAHAQARTWANGISLYTQVLQTYPDARAAENNIGMEYLRIGRYDDAIAAFDRSLGVRQDPRTMVNRAAALAAKGANEEAMNEYMKVMEIAPEIPDSYYGIGNINYKQGKLVEAETWYRKALDVKSDYANALNNLGGVELRLKEWDKAIETLTQSINVNPDFATSYYNLGWAYENKNDLQNAEHMYSKAAELSPDDPDVLSSLARILYARKDIDAAATLLRQALSIDSSNPIAIGVVMQMKKDGVAE